MAPQTPVLLLDNFADTVTQYPSAVLTVPSARVGYEADRVADYRRERTSWQASAAATAHAFDIDLGSGVAKAASALYFDRGHNLAGVTVAVSYSDDGSSFTTVFTSVMPVAGTLGGDPTTGFCITEEGAAYRFFSLTGAHRYWRIYLTKASTFLPVVPGIILGAKLQLLGFSATFDEDAGERTQEAATSRAGYRGAEKTYAWRTLELDLRYVGATEYDNSIRAARELMFERNEPAVIVMDYGTHPERAWMYQYEGTAWAMPKSRVYRAGRFRFREVGASLN
jgi:hypothetical protein